jgi:phage tail-like protein
MSIGMPIGANWLALRARSYAATKLGLRFDPYMAFNFVIELEGLLVGGFHEISGLESHIETTSHVEGGVNHYAHALIGRADSGHLKLTQGLSSLSILWHWYSQGTHGIIRRRNGTITLLDTQQLPLIWWNFRNAFPVSWSGPQFNAGSDTVAFETIELVHEGFSHSF